MLERYGSLYNYVLDKLRLVNKSFLALQNYSTDKNYYKYQILLVSTYFLVHVRILTSTHDILTELIIQEIRSQLKRVAHRNIDNIAILDLVRSESSSDI